MSRLFEDLDAALASVHTPAEVDEIWRRHALLCPFDDERCAHLPEIVEAYNDAIESFDDKRAEIEKEAREDERKDVEAEVAEKLSEKEERIGELEAELEEAKSFSDVDRKSATLSAGRREAEAEVLGRLREAMTKPAKELRREIHDLVVELLKRVNEKGTGT